VTGAAAGNGETHGGAKSQMVPVFTYHLSPVVFFTCFPPFFTILELRKRPELYLSTSQAQEKKLSSASKALKRSRAQANTGSSTKTMTKTKVKTM